MNDSLAVRKGERFGDLLKIKQRVVQSHRMLAAQRPQIASGHVFENDVVKGHAFEVGSGAVPEPQNDVRMANAVNAIASF